MGTLMMYGTTAKLTQAILVKNEPLGAGGAWSAYMVALMSKSRFTVIKRKAV